MGILGMFKIRNCDKTAADKTTDKTFDYFLWGLLPYFTHQTKANDLWDLF